ERRHRRLHPLAAGLNCSERPREAEQRDVERRIAERAEIAAVEVAPELALDRLADDLGAGGVLLGSRRIVTDGHRRRRTQSAADRRRREGVTAFALLPEVGRRNGQSVLLDRAEQEVGRAYRRGPQIRVERPVA